jgi:hypothetical protein
LTNQTFLRRAFALEEGKMPLFARHSAAGDAPRAGPDVSIMETGSSSEAASPDGGRVAAR